MLCIKEDNQLGAGQITEQCMAENLGILRIEIPALGGSDPMDFIRAFPAVLNQMKTELHNHIL